jgi:hypothetical protein
MSEDKVKVGEIYHPDCDDCTGLFDQIDGAELIEIKNVTKHGNFGYYILDVELKRLASGSGGWKADQLSKVKKIKNPAKHYKLAKEESMSMLNTLSTFAKKHLDKDVKSFVQLGWMDESLEVTDEGCNALMAYLFDLHKVELGKLAAEEIKEIEKEDK